MTETAANAPVVWTSRHSLSLGLLLAGIVLIELFLPTSVRVLRWLGVLILMTAFVLVIGQGITGHWLGVLIDTTQKMSLSRLQLLLWSMLILSGLLSAVATNIAAGVSEPLAITIPAPLWLLLGISTTSMVGSPLLQNFQASRQASVEMKQRVLAQCTNRAVDLLPIRFSGQLVINQSMDAASIADLFEGASVDTVGFVNVGQMQMFFFTVILIFAYGAALARLFTSGTAITALPSLDTGMLVLLGISHAGFLANQVGSQNINMYPAHTTRES